MNEKTAKQMAKMVDALQPHCDDTIIAAMTCSHAGSLSSLLISRLSGGFGAGAKTSDLPNPVFIGVGTEFVYAFKYAPRGFKFKIKKEAGRWPRKEITVKAEKKKALTTFVMGTRSGEYYAFEVATFMGGAELVDAFLAAFER
ncbi:hypothetical protein JXO52_12110 [bacterium]|nr:hypothetical protein [bacterium]